MRSKLSRRSLSSDRRRDDSSSLDPNMSMEDDSINGSSNKTVTPSKMLRDNKVVFMISQCDDMEDLEMIDSINPERSSLLHDEHKVS